MLARCARRPQRRSELDQLTSAFAFCNDEELFAKELLHHKPNFWIFRTHQQRFCGDFIVIDMSSPDPELRSTWAIDLKTGADLKMGGGGAGIQFQNVASAIDEIARTQGIITQETPCTRLVGDRTLLLAHLGCSLVGVC